MIYRRKASDNEMPTKGNTTYMVQSTPVYQKQSVSGMFLKLIDLALNEKYIQREDMIVSDYSYLLSKIAVESVGLLASNP